MSKPTWPGTDPYLAGYWSFVWGEERQPPDWLPGHKVEEYRQEWERGYDDAQQKLDADLRTVRQAKAAG